ncbi:hypothetical protein LEP1GSC083_2637 [Leptospira interrogans serovar Pyrogenes str. L0374]|uniref:Uncharacterized protein n=1 Tax=Leptospira interrogans serovar Pyrogenes str. L0374 TaxID=1049928 RepID=M6K8H0_LEPIR|nr:hypothetical protein LEP1GSC083_2637 [Leptospira interrogans serovar Pyrogenes str. L0374]
MDRSARTLQLDLSDKEELDFRMCCKLENKFLLVSIVHLIFTIRTYENNTTISLFQKLE